MDQHLELGTEGFSPWVIRAAVRQGAGGAEAYAAASVDLQELAGVKISAKHIQRLSGRIGGEWKDQRDREVAAYKNRQLPRDYPQAAPAVAAVMVDSGKVQTRAAGESPGVHDPHWKNTNVACCLTLKSKVWEEDPQPEPPRKFLDPPKVLKLVAQIHARGAGGAGAESKERRRAAGGQNKKDKKAKDNQRRAARRTRKKRAAQDNNRRKGPVKLVRTTLATMENWERFGWQVGAEVQRRSLDLAARKAFVCDGQACNWTMYDLHFQPSGFVPILDVLHLLGYLYAAAFAAAGPAAKAAWECYEKWLRLAWSGQTATLLAQLKAAADRLGPPPAAASESDPRRTLAEALGYVTNNQHRMDYPRYRKLGLPISSAPVESVIKQYNQRIKGTEKFWVEQDVEAIQQIRAAYLSEDGRAEKYWKRPRPYRHAVGLGRLHSKAA